VLEVNRRESGNVEGLEDRRLTHIHSVLHGELEVLVRFLRLLGVEELLQANGFVVELGCDPFRTSPQLFVEPGVGAVGIHDTISSVDTSDGSDVSEVLLSFAICGPSSTREESVCAVSGGSLKEIKDGSGGVIQHQVTLEHVARAHHVEGIGSLRVVAFDDILNGVLLGDATKGVVGDQPGVRVHNSSQVVCTNTSEEPHVSPVGTNTRRDSTLGVR